MVLLSTMAKNILIIEDEEVQREAFVLKFTNEDYTILTASDGEEGYFVAIKYRPDIILLDLMMPKMDGMTVLKKLRNESDWGKKVPVIILTNLTPYEEQRMRDIQQTEPVFYVTKSNISLNDLAEKVREQLEIPH